MHFLVLYFDENAKKIFVNKTNENLENIIDKKEICGDIDREIFNYLEALLPFKKEIYEISKTEYISLWLTLYPDSYQLNFHLSNKTCAALTEYGIKLDISVMNLQDFYNGNVPTT